MKRIIGIFFLLALLAGCATAQVLGRVGDDIKAEKETVQSVSGDQWFEMLTEWGEIVWAIFP